MTAGYISTGNEEGVFMQWSGWIYFGGTVALFIAFVVAVVYYFSPKRKAKVEDPKYRMLEDDEVTIKKQVDTKERSKKQ